jgi:hypothetical protein
MIVKRNRLVASAWGGVGGVFFIGLLALALLVPLTTSAWGADPLGTIRDQEITQTLRLKAGQSKVLRLPFAITRILGARPLHLGPGDSGSRR